MQATSLKHWPPHVAQSLTKLIQQHAHQGQYAVFDMDNTSYLYDISDYMLAYLEHHQVISRATLPNELRLIPFQDKLGYTESLYAYCRRLRQFDRLICFPWMAQIFAGLSLGELKQQVDHALQLNQPIEVQYLKEERLQRRAIHPPIPFRGMQELYTLLQRHGIEVFVITASSEELVRNIACDPQYGYNVKTENVLGVNLLLKDPISGAIVLSRSLEHPKRFNHQQRHRDLQLTTYLVSPMTWFEGKAGSMLAWIDRWRKPILVAGDSALSDGFMLLNSTDTAQGGVRLWIDHGSQQNAAMLQLREQGVKAQQKLAQASTADDNWLVVTPQQIL